MVNYKLIRIIIQQIIYLNPTASNPAGTTLTTNRKREIYRLACEYDMLILEDDPYYYLHFGPVSLNIYLF
jgi:DNA-binding transcriptional MocR family regulator